MKVVHVLKRIEMIDNDVKDLKKLEKSIQRDKSFATPIYMSIEKQINILLGERIKLLELKVENPPQHLVEEIEGESGERVEEIPKPTPKKKAAPKKKAVKKAKPKKKSTDEIPMLTQDDIDAKFEKLREAAGTDKKKKAETEKEPEETQDEAADNVKLLDIALEKGTVNTKNMEKEKKVRFFRENFPTD